MKWIHQKNLRNKELKELFENRSPMYPSSMYRSACIMRSYSFCFPSINKRQFESICGFNQHPNSSQEM
jgi:hypothetical protein